MEKAQLKPGSKFQDFLGGPVMTVVPPGSFEMGTPGGLDSEGPVRIVKFEHPFAISIYPVTFDEWDFAVAQGGVAYKPDEAPKNPHVVGGVWERGRRPVINVDWNDAREFASWLEKKASRRYRLPSEAEWEYCCRAGTRTSYSFGDSVAGKELVCCRDGGDQPPKNTSSVGSYSPNAFGLYDMHGNVWEWVEDSRNEFTYAGAPCDGSPWVKSEQAFRVLRGGSWVDTSDKARSAYRKWSTNGYRFDGGTLGFRVVRDLTPAEMGLSISLLTRVLSRHDMTHLLEEEGELHAIQAGILRPFQERHFVSVSAKITNPELAKSGLSSYSRDIASAAQQEEAGKDRSASADQVYSTVHLSSSAYKKMGYSQGSFSSEFWEGMESAAERLSDSARFSAPDLLFHFASDSAAAISARLRALYVATRNWAILVDFRQGYRKRDRQGRALGPLGFVDGISQPIFIESSEPWRINSAVWSDYSSPNVVLCPDHLSANESAGSYLVARYYYIDEKRFWSKAADIANASNGQLSKYDISAMAFGRHRNGAPLTRYEKAVPKYEANDFTYSDDPIGLRCPFHAHARKMNPRGEHLGEQERYRRIARRGYPFGLRRVKLEIDLPSEIETGRSGLLFLCFQRSVSDQFEFLQSAWANDETFQFGNFPSIDPIIGNPRLPIFGDPNGDYYVEQKSSMRWPLRWGSPDAGLVAGEIQGVVELFGGGYFFTPSITGLAKMA